MALFVLPILLLFLLLRLHSSFASVCTVPASPIVYGISKHTLPMNKGKNEREYRLYVPRSYNGSVPVPVIFYFPGWTNSCDNYEAGCTDTWCNFRQYAETYGFLFVSACGYGNSWNAGSCCPPANSADNDINDTDYSVRILRRLQKNYCTDERRIYATGYSNGGMMAQKLGCERPDIFRAIATVAGVTVLKDTSSSSSSSVMVTKNNRNDGSTLTSLQLCTKMYNQRINTTSKVKAISILDIHGKEDAYVPLEGNLFLGFPSVYENMEQWKRRIGCGTRTTILTTKWTKYPYTGHEYTECTNNSIIELIIHSKGDHSWYENNMVMNSTDYIVKFFERSAYQQYGIVPLSVPVPAIETVTDKRENTNDIDTVIDVGEMAKRRKRRQTTTESAKDSLSSPFKPTPAVREEDDTKEDLLMDLNNLINSLSKLTDDSGKKTGSGRTKKSSSFPSVSDRRSGSNPRESSGMAAKKETDASNLFDGFEGLADLNALMNSLDTDNGKVPLSSSSSSKRNTDGNDVGNGLESLTELMESLQKLGDATNTEMNGHIPQRTIPLFDDDAPLSSLSNDKGTDDISMEDLESLMKTFASFGDDHDTTTSTPTLPKRSNRRTSSSSTKTFTSSSGTLKKNRKNSKGSLSDQDDTLPFEAFEL